MRLHTRMYVCIVLCMYNVFVLKYIRFTQFSFNSVVCQGTIVSLHKYFTFNHSVILDLRTSLDIVTK